MSDSSADTGQGTGMYWDRKGAWGGVCSPLGTELTLLGLGQWGSKVGPLLLTGDGRQHDPRPVGIDLLGAVSWGLTVGTGPSEQCLMSDGGDGSIRAVSWVCQSRILYLMMRTALSEQFLCLTVLTLQGCALRPACSAVPTVTPRRCSGPARWGRTSCHPARRCRSSCQRRPPAPWGTSRATGAPVGWWPGSCRDPSAARQLAWRYLGTASMGTNRWVLEATGDGQLLLPRELPSTFSLPSAPISTSTLAFPQLLFPCHTPAVLAPWLQAEPSSCSSALAQPFLGGSSFSSIPTGATSGKIMPVAMALALPLSHCTWRQLLGHPGNSALRDAGDLAQPERP